jgi:hypothetical protein
MNLHAIAGAYISSVNPSVVGTVMVSSGATVNADYTQAPNFQPFTNQTFQVQAASTGDLRQVENLNLQGVYRKVYLNGAIEGLDRLAGKGGDLLLFNNATWLVVAVLEPWTQSGWVCVLVAQQG